MEESSASSFLEEILTEALATHCSDVHMQLGPQGLEISFRKPGQLTPYRKLGDSGGLIMRRAKALARMDITDARVPQDGSFVLNLASSSCDVRVAVIPTVQGESLVLRLLPNSDRFQEFSHLGMTAGQAAELDQILTASSGLVLVAGATGSGKTTTLYTMMHRLSKRGRNVVSIEDPVEAPLSSCRQMEVRERVGVTFEVGLRALLRQDPDVIMIGEIRDEVTAKVALRAALTGHLVLTTTHARDMVGAAARLVDFGLSRALLSDVLLAVIIQELHPQPCSICSGQGCTDCQGTGWGSDRQAVFAIQSLDTNQAALLSSNLSWSQVRRGMEERKYEHQKHDSLPKLRRVEST